MPLPASLRPALAPAALAAAVLLWSAIGPKDRFTWLLETAPAFIGWGALLWLAARGTRITVLLLWAASFHAAILAVGGHWTYAEVPLFDWLRQPCGFARNHYDRLGHLVQGAVPALIAREVLARRGVVASWGWAGFLAGACALAFSAFYELLEWWTALATGERADAFLGTQGDPWDTQADMCCALIGAAAALCLLSRLHRRQLGAP